MVIANKVTKYFSAVELIVLKIVILLKTWFSEKEKSWRQEYSWNELSFMKITV